MPGLDDRKGLGSDAQTVLASLYRDSPGQAEFIELRTVRRDGSVRQEFIPHAELTRAAARAIELRDSGDVYFGVGLRARQSGGKDAVLELPAVWVDLDSSETLVELALFPLPPTLVIATGSPGRTHAYWFTRESIDPAVAEALNRELAQVLGGDPQAVDAARVLRLPGTLNHKYDPPAEVRLSDFTAKYYTEAELRAALPEAESAIPTTTTRGAAAMPASDSAETSGAVARILDRLEGVAPASNGWTAHCPAHDDEHPSLSIAEGGDGRCLLKCHAGCSPEDIVHAIDLELSDLFADDGHAARPSVAAELVAIAERHGAKFFHDSSDRAFASIPVGTHRETVAISDKKFKRWLRRHFHREQGRVGRVANSQAIADAVDLLCAIAEFDGPEVEVFVRVAPYGGGVVIDLADDEWRAVLVAPDKVEILTESPVPFIRGAATRALPVPVWGGSLDEFRQFINVADEGAWRLIVSFLVAALVGRGPFPVLILQGEGGSGKSTTARAIRLVSDPAHPALRGGRPDDRDLMVAALTNWVVAFDNFSGLSVGLSDSLCRLSTGAGFGTRRLYTDEEEIVFDAMRPIMLNGLAHIASRPDLLSRAIVLELPVLDEESTLLESEFYERLDEARSRIFGALLGLAAEVLALLPEVELERSPRMADFARVGVAVERALEWPEGSFLAAYRGQQAEAFEAALDADPLPAVLLKFMEQHSQLDGWSGTATELLAKLTNLADDEVKRRRNWPTSASVLGKRLKELVPALRPTGLEIEKASSGRGTGKQRRLRIFWAARDGDGGDGGDGDA